MLGSAEAKVFANVDGSVNLQLSLEVSETIKGDVGLVSRGTSVPQNSTFGGCVEVGTGISVNVGAEGSLFGLFEDSIAKELFARNFTLFQVRLSAPIGSIFVVLMFDAFFHVNRNVSAIPRNGT